MQGLKALVIFMGVLIVIGLGIPAYGIATKFGGKEKQGAAGTAPTVEQPVSVGTAVKTETFGDLHVTLPRDAQVVAVTPSASLLFVRYRRLDGNESVVVVDLSAGRQLGTIHLDLQGAQ